MSNDITMYVILIVIGGFIMVVYIFIQSLVKGACNMVKRWWISRSKRVR